MLLISRSVCALHRLAAFSLRKLPGFLIFTLLNGYAAAGENPVSGQFIDLTYAFDEDTIYWPTAEPFELEVVFKGENERGYHYEANNFSAAEHGGTHMDAPAHFYRDRHTMEEIPLERLISEAVLVDVSTRCSDDPDCQIDVDDLKAWEAQNDMRLDHAVVLLRTGWGRFWPDRSRYMGTTERGEEAIAKLRFPGLHPDAARWLAEQRVVKAVGLDTPSIDFGRSRDFGSHVALSRQNIPIFENLANLDRLPPTGFTVVALPMKIRGGSGGPLRIIAVLPD